MTANLLTAGLIGQVFAFVLSIVYIRVNKNLIATAAKSVLILSWIFITSIIVFNWINEGRPPFKTLYESLILLAWCINLTGIFSYFGNKYPLLWLFVSLSASITIIYALVYPDIEKTLLPPALQSVWFIPHVVVYFIGYSALMIGSLGLLAGNKFNERLGNLFKSEVLKNTDASSLNFKIVRIGYLFLTIGLVLGAVWADQAWGTYWGWDPKESWALTTFFIYGGFMHFTQKDQQLKWGKLLLILGVGSILFTYLGMHLLPTAETSMHVYQ